MSVNGLSTLGTPPAATDPLTKKTTSTDTTSKALSGLTEDFSTFIKLLTVQLKNQNPLDPTNTNDFTNQIVQFANVEQNIAGNQKLDKLITLQQSNQISSVVSYTGKPVEIKSDTFVVKQGEPEQIAYQLDTNVTDSLITIKNEDGTTIYSGKGETDKGRHTVDVDKLDLSQTLTPGKYTVTVNYKVDGDKDFTKSAQTYTAGKVTAVNLTDGQVGTLVVDDVIQVDLKDVTFVGAASDAAKSKSPVISGFAGSEKYTGSELTVDNDLQITDDDSSTMTGAVVMIDELKDGSDEKLNVTLQEGISIKSNNDGILVLSGVATREAYQQVLRSLTYKNDNTSPDTSDRTISIIVGDGVNSSNRVVKTITYA
ncbi:MAG: hypothetical protein EB060_04070 [Proteobacteria bacterium]|nr:hypothetical protein [Pseudomonadota bacterium]